MAPLAWWFSCRRTMWLLNVIALSTTTTPCLYNVYTSTMSITIRCLYVLLTVIKCKQRWCMLGRISGADIWCMYAVIVCGIHVYAMVDGLVTWWLYICYGVHCSPHPLIWRTAICYIVLHHILIIYSIKLYVLSFLLYFLKNSIGLQCVTHSTMYVICCRISPIHNWCDLIVQYRSPHLFLLPSLIHGSFHWTKRPNQPLT